MAEYTEDEIVTRIKEIDTEIRLMLITGVSGGRGASPPTYKIGDKSVDFTAKLTALQAQRKLYTEELGRVAGGTHEVWQPMDYEVDQTGHQLGDQLDGDEFD